MKKKSKRNYIRIAILILILICAPINIYAKESGSSPEEQVKVKVGIGNFTFFSKRNDEGEYKGIVIDYLNEIVKYTGWEIEYVEGKPEELLGMLLSGEIDLMGGMNKSEELQQFLDFAEISSGYAYSALVVKSDATQYAMSDYDSFEGMRVGMYEKATSRNKAFEQFCETNKIAVEKVYYEDLKEWDACVKNGEADAILKTSEDIRSGEKMIARFAPKPFYFAVNKEKKEITRQLNVALEKINKVNPQFERELLNSYFENARQQETLELTGREKAFIKEHPTILVAAAPEWKPVSYYEEKTAENKGISADMLDYVAMSTGLKFEYVPVASFEEAVNLLKAGKIDLISGIYRTEFLEQDKNFVYSIPYLTTQSIIVQRKDNYKEQWDDSIMAVPYGADYSNHFAGEMKPYPSAQKCMEAVKKKEAEFAVVGNLVAENYLWENGTAELLVTPINSFMTQVVFAYYKPINPEFMSIMDKAIFHLSEAERQTILFQNNPELTEKISFTRYLNSNPIAVVTVVLLLSITAIITLFVFMKMRMKLLEKVALSGQAYRIIGELTDEYLFEYDFKHKSLTLPSELAELAGCRDKLEEIGEEGTLAGLRNKFLESGIKEQFSYEFKIELPEQKEEWYRAVCAVLLDAHKVPVRGLGKIINIQEEVVRVNTDGLTGLYYKEYCEKTVRQLISKEKSGDAIAMFLIDLDYFKQVNDTFGHMGGDEVLRCFAHTLKDEFSQKDILGRWGGDEFFVFMPDTTKEKTSEIAQRLCSKMDKVYQYNGKEQKISISIGITYVEKTSTTCSYEVMLEQADAALYEVKNKGRNAFVFFGDVL